MPPLPPCSRRIALRVLAGSIGAVAAGAAACTPPPPPRCDDTTGLADADKASRTQLAYVDRAPEPSKACDRCVQWQVGPSSHQCGGCRLFKGPVSPSGTCKVFAPRV